MLPILLIQDQDLVSTRCADRFNTDHAQRSSPVSCARGEGWGNVHVTPLTPPNESLCYTCRLETFLSLNSEGVSDGTSYCCI